MNLRTRFSRLVLTLALLALATYGLADQQIPIAFLFALLAGAGWWVTETRAGGGLPRWVIGLLLLLVVARAAYEMGVGEFSISPFSGFLASVIVLKLWSRRQVRDYAQLLSISLFLNIGSILNSNSLLVGLLLMTSIPLFIHAVMLLQIYAGHARALERSAEAAPTAASLPAVALPPLPVERRSVRQLVGLTAASIVFGLGVSLFVFIIVPRDIGREVLGILGRPSAGRVLGFTDQVQLGTAGLISQSEAAVLEARLEAEGVSLERIAPGGRLYLRGAVLDRYERGLWNRGPRLYSTSTEIFLNQRFTLSRPPAGERFSLQVRFFGSVSKATPLFTTGRPYEVTMLDGSGRLAWQDGTSELHREGNPTAIEYSVSCVSPALDIEDEWTREPTDFDSPRLQALAEEIARAGGIDPDPGKRRPTDDARLARLFESHLRERCTYTLEILAAPPDGRDPTEWFVFDRKQGHCEYFASALAALCRTVGVQARVVAGYLAAESEPDSGEYLVRQTNAHAWVEVRVAPERWQTYDATPSTTLNQITTPRTGLFAAITHWLDSAENLWSANVVNFDQSSRDSLVGGWDRAWESWRRNFRSGGNASSGSWRLPRLADPLLAVVIAATVLLGAAIAWATWRRTRRLRAADLRTRALLGDPGRLYRDLERLLATLGHARPPWQAPLAFAHALAVRDPAVGDRARVVVALCYRAWFGGQRWTPDDLAVAERALAELESGSAWSQPPILA